MNLAKKTQPLVIHIQEINQRQQQQLLIRVIKASRSALEKKVWESVFIDRLSSQGDICLNLKSEWGLSKGPSLENKATTLAKPPPKKSREEERRVEVASRKRAKT